MNDEEILSRRDWLATVTGVRNRNADGEAFDEGPCNMLLGNAILHVAKLEEAACEHRGASVTLDGFELDSATCRALAIKFGDRLFVLE